MEGVELAATVVLHAAAFIAHTLGLKDLHHDIVKSWHGTRYILRMNVLSKSHKAPIWNLRRA
jgi:hypothetical protein